MFLLDKLSFAFGPGKDNVNNDFKVLSSANILLKDYDLLLFTDSKGSAENQMQEKTWTEMLISNLEDKKIDFLLISRPKEMTLFFTLISFLKSNKIKFKTLITNVGFVDTTPKKEEFIDDILLQNPFVDKELIKFPLCEYVLSSGEKATLFSVDYSNVIQSLSDFISNNFEHSYLLGVFEFSLNIKIIRERPKEFYSQLKEANKLIKSICSFNEKLNFVDVNQNLSFDESQFSYDAVHFTEKGHERMFEICLKEIKL